MSTPTLIMTLGLSGSGKSTWAQEQVAKAAPGAVVRLNNDDLGRAMFGGRRGGNDTRVQIEETRDTLLVNALLRGLTVIVDNTNIHPKHETRLREMAAMYGAVFRIQDFTHVPVEECIARDAQRTGPAHLGKDIIVKQSIQLARRKVNQQPLYPQPYVAPEGLPTCWIFDVDGTLALKEQGPGSRDYYDWPRVGEDLPNEPVIEMAQALILAGETIVVMSGRDGICFPETQGWLDKYVAPGLPLFMRAPGDRRPDSIVKFELFQAHVAGRFRVKTWVDDRDQVIQMARRVLHIPTWQVAEGRF